MKKKALAFAAMACSVAMLLSACGGSNSNAASGDTAGSNIITAYNSEPQNPLIPGNTNETGGGKPGDLLFSRLVSFDKDGKASNEVAESITPNDDATQYTIKIKSGWKFTDGTPVTAESFTKAWSYVANAKNAQKCSSFFSTIAGYDDLQKDGLKGDEQLSGLKVVDDTTFTVDLNQSDSVFPIKVGYLAFAPLPESFYKDPKAFGEKPVSNGPYKLDHWDHNKEIALVKNPDYKGNEQPKNDGVTFKVYTDDSAAYRDIQGGDLDVMDSVPAAFTTTFKTDKKVQAYSEAGSVIQTFTIPSGPFSTNHRAFGHHQARLDGVRVRGDFFGVVFRHYLRLRRVKVVRHRYLIVSLLLISVPTFVTGFRRYNMSLVFSGRYCGDGEHRPSFLDLTHAPKPWCSVRCRQPCYHPTDPLRNLLQHRRGLRAHRTRQGMSNGQVMLRHGARS